MAVAPSTRATTSPSEVEAQKLTGRPTTAFRQTEPLGAGVILTRTPSASKYLSCSATQIAPKAKFGTAVMRLTSGNSFCCARACERPTNKRAKPAISTIANLRVFIRPPLPILDFRYFGYAQYTFLDFRLNRKIGNPKSKIIHPWIVTCSLWDCH